MDALIEADGLTQDGSGRCRPSRISPSPCRPGQPVAILGPNGAGKTTFIRMVATLLEPDRGTLTRRRARRGARPDGGAPHDRPGRPVRRGRGDDDRPREPASWWPACTARAGRRRWPRPSAILEQMDLVDAADRQVRTYSGGHATAARPRGQPRRVAPAAAARRADDRARPGQSQRGVGRRAVR